MGLRVRWVVSAQCSLHSVITWLHPTSHCLLPTPQPSTPADLDLAVELFNLGMHAQSSQVESGRVDPSPTGSSPVGSSRDEDIAVATLLHACVRAGSPEQAIETFDRLRANGYTPRCSGPHAVVLEATASLMRMQSTEGGGGGGRGGAATVDGGSSMRRQGPGLVAEGPGLVAEGPGLVDEGPGLAEQGPGLVVKGPGLVAEGPGLAFDSSGRVRWTGRQGEVRQGEVRRGGGVRRGGEFRPGWSSAARFGHQLRGIFDEALSAGVPADGRLLAALLTAHMRTGVHMYMPHVRMFIYVRSIARCSPLGTHAHRCEAIGYSVQRTGCSLRSSRHTCACVCAHTCAHTCTHTHAHTHMRTCTYTCT